MHGSGKVIWPDGKTYTGEFADGKMQGKGLKTWPEELGGGQFDGAFVEDMMVGKGVMTWPDGGVYTGDFLNDKMEGTGVKTWSDGRKYEGQYEDGL